MEQQNGMHWNQMNCILNKKLDNTIINSEKSQFYISENPPPDYISPDGITLKTYHPINLNGDICDTIDDDIINKIIKFIGVNDVTGTGNITELSKESLDRFMSIPCVIGILFNSDNNIIGTMISVILRVRYNNIDLLTSYTTFLCIDKLNRTNGLAMILIRGIMKEGYIRYGINHGYYMTTNVHHKINYEIKSWYRPINVQKASASGFTLATFERKGDRNMLSRQKSGYHISKPKNIPVKVDYESYDRVINILRQSQNNLYLIPTLNEYKNLCKCFDIYVVNNNYLFMLFPMDSIISETGKRVHNAQLALMIGNVLQEALWIAKQNNYDLLYGYCFGDIKQEDIKNIKGHITNSTTFLEFYNTKNNIDNDNLFVPIF